MEKKKISAVDTANEAQAALCTAHAATLKAIALLPEATTKEKFADMAKFEYWEQMHRDLDTLLIDSIKSECPI